MEDEPVQFPCAAIPHPIFRKLVTEISERLEVEEVRKCSFIHDLPQKSNTALDTLEWLIKRGNFSNSNVQPLIKLLKDINRCDLVSMVNEKCLSVEGHLRIGRTTSLPSQPSPNMSTFNRKERAKTIMITVSEEPPYSSPSQPAEQLRTILALPAPETDDKNTALKPSSSDSEVVKREKNGHEVNDSRRESASQSVYNITLNTYNGTPPTTPVRSGYNTPGSTGGILPQSHRSSFTEKSPLSNSLTPEKLVNTVHEKLDGNEDEKPLEMKPINPPDDQTSQGDELSSNIYHSKNKWNLETKWSFSRAELQTPIWQHQFLYCIQCQKPIPIDIGSSDQNPSLSLFLYPFGLFDDKNKSITLMIKVVIPDFSPPIPSREAFELSWGVSINTEGGPKTLGGSKKATKIKFKTGVKYLHNILAHKTLMRTMGETLELHLHISTSYSINSTYDNTGTSL